MPLRKRSTSPSGTAFAFTNATYCALGTSWLPMLHAWPTAPPSEPVLGSAALPGLPIGELIVTDDAEDAISAGSGYGNSGTRISPPMGARTLRIWAAQSSIGRAHPCLYPGASFTSRSPAPRSVDARRPGLQTRRPSPPSSSASPAAENPSSTTTGQRDCHASSSRGWRACGASPKARESRTSTGSFTGEWGLRPPRYRGFPGIREQGISWP
jgi:hypothetical protein